MFVLSSKQSTTSSQRDIILIYRQTSEAYHQIYGRLKSNGNIRLIRILPGQFSDPIQGELILCSLSDHPSYEALSYTWGDPESTCPIAINGSSLQVTTNLASALRHIRTPDSPRVLWIDAICINQRDFVERSHQVAIMPKIYQRAENVIIWLGSESETSAVGMEILAFLSSETADYSNAPWATNPPELCHAGLQDIMSRAWFRRLWVVQEAALSQRATLTCGQRRIVWNSDPQRVRRLIRMIKYAEISPQWEKAGLKDIDMGMLLGLLEMREKQVFGLNTAHEASDLLDIAYAMRNRQVTDPRDRLFALFGIVNDPGGVLRDFPPDYNLTVEETHKRLMEVLQI